MSKCLAFVWCLSALGRTDFSPSSDEQMPPTDITQDMRVLAFLAGEAVDSAPPCQIKLLQKELFIICCPSTASESH